ncbi:MAG: sigma-70 family RNA polymerase sigma factor [Chloroflexi bacterium]|nr:sigma-70 family RNA polymerase sigma factor [Chloroflexota bacterium]
MESYVALVERAQNAHDDARHEAFSELIKRFEAAAYQWAYSLLEDEHAAQDAAQEAFIAAYDHLPQLREPAAFPGWFKQIVLSRCHRQTRRKRLPSAPFEDENAAYDPHAELEAREQRDSLLAALHALPEHERTVTELFYVSGYAQREIAEQLAVPLTTVKKRLQYAREHLRGVVQPLNALAVVGGDSPTVRDSLLDALLVALLGGLPREISQPVMSVYS